MTLCELDNYFRGFLKIEDYATDPSRNGIQIQNSAPDKKQIKKVAFAVDACEATALAAVENGADLLFVHHGLFWGDCEVITGSVYARYSAFLKNDLALYACHIPLDANNPYGNNYGLAARLELKNLKPFGEWRSSVIGVKGELDAVLSIEQLAEKVLKPGEKTLAILPFGKKEIKTVGIISGGAAGDVNQAVSCNLDAYITGEVNHEIYHYVRESKINVIGAGHYQTETIGVNLVRAKLEKETGIETIFIDIPTGL